jgi:hypothetical protein
MQFSGARWWCPNPQMHAVVFAEVRKAVVARFPHCVFYR